MKYLLLLLLQVSFLPATVPPRWKNVTDPVPSNRNLTGLAFSGSRYVTVGDQGTIRFSSDLSSWTDAKRVTREFLTGVAWGGDRFVAVGHDATILSSLTGERWSVVETQNFSGGTDYNAVDWVGDRFVLTGNGGLVRGSSDGITWTTRTTPTTEVLRAAVSNGTRTVVVGGRTSGSNQPLTVLWSDNGAVWTEASAPPMAPSSFTNLNDVAWTGSKFIAVGSRGMIATSSDGEAWTVETSGTSVELHAIQVQGGAAVIVGSRISLKGTTSGDTWVASSSFDDVAYDLIWDGTRYLASGWKRLLLSSLNGTSWQSKSLDLEDPVASASGAEKVVVVGSGGYLATSTAASGYCEWTTRVSGTAEDLQDIVFAGGEFVAVGDQGTILQSSDGVTWNAVSSGTSQNLLSIAHGAGRFMAVGGGTILTSTDGLTWTGLTSGVSSGLSLVAYGDGIFVAGGSISGGQVVYSNNFTSWNQAATGLSQSLDGIAWGGGEFLISRAFSSQIARSTDGVSWTTGQVPIFSSFNDFQYSGGRFIGLGNTVMLSSNDGVTWKFGGPPANLKTVCSIGIGSLILGSNQTVLYSETWGDWENRKSLAVKRSYAGIPVTGGYLVVGDQSQILFSVDGKNWSTRLGTAAGRRLRGVADSGALVVAAGSSGRVLTSTDLIEWTERTTGVSSDLYDVVHDGSQFLACGANGVILTSTDGISWTQQSSGTSVTLQSIISAGGQYLAAGDSGVVVRSSDTLSWTIGNAGVAQSVSDLVWNGSSYFAAADTGGIRCSTDGVAWTDCTPVGTFSRFTALTFDGLRLHAVDTNAELWTSVDGGSSWTSSGLFSLSRQEALLPIGQEILALGESNLTLVFPESQGAVAQAAMAAGFAGGDALPAADPDLDGVANGVALIFNIPLGSPVTPAQRALLPQAVPGAASTGSLQMTLPQTLPEGAIICVDQSNILSGWTEIARKVGNSSWTGMAAVTETPTGGGTQVKVDEIEDTGVQSSFLRLRTVLDE